MYSEPALLVDSSFLWNAVCGKIQAEYNRRVHPI